MLNFNIHKRARMGTVIMGVGLGGFADGILLHQILQWHHMLSSIMPPSQMDAMVVNMRWDGIFHAFVWLMTLSGGFMVWNSGRHRTVLPHGVWFAGWLIFGWGLFNFIEGIVNHHIFSLHHVRYAGDIYGADPSMAWGIGFILVGGLGFMLVGWLVSRYGMRLTPVT